ncbi:response regulator [Vallitalea pronyensis]|uniref:Stage 0 sporulation protein A homolog n=1 Tax=Vallitalea pronyensis TaxID=1348613 RepID=A0A8J8MJ10_9FIRM|nr:response regulator [Vallitalea pronyensis]QUI22474.1 response regulator [Vallitalea pronyensis]
MYKVAVIDDEPYIRDSLVNTIDWKGLHCSLVFAAEEGKSAYASILKHEPDIILLDIHMPGMSGLEIVEKIVQKNMACKIVIISAYQDFNYVKQALQLGVFDYIAKPIRNREVKDIVIRAKKVIDEERRKKTEEKTMQEEMEVLTEYFKHTKQLLSSQVIHNMIHHQSYDESLLMLPENIQKHATLVIQSQSKESDRVVNKKYILDFIDSIKAKVDYQMVQTIMNGDIVLVLFFSKNTSAHAYKIYAKRLSIAILDFVKEWEDVGIYIGISTLYNDVDSLSHSYKEALNAAGNHFFSSNKDIVFVDEEHTNKRHAKFSIVHDLDYFYHTLVNGEEKALEKQLELLIAGIENYAGGNISVAKTLLSEICITIARYSASHVANNQKLLPLNKVLFDINELNHMDEAFAYIKNYLKSALHVPEKDPDYSPLVNKVIKYIKQHYMHGISLNSTSQEVALNPSYLSRMLKKETGRNFSDIVLEERMKAAKNMLRNPKLRLNEIAVQIGYKDYSYFYQVFSKYEGMTPMQYRKTCKEI